MTSFLPTNAVIIRKCPMSANFVESVFIFILLLLPSAESIYILFSGEGAQDENSSIQPNNFIPLILCENSRKRSYPNEATKSVAKKIK